MKDGYCDTNDDYKPFGDDLSGKSPTSGSPVVTSKELWDLRQRVLSLGMSDPWDAESGCPRPVPAGFEEEVAKFDELQSEQIKRINETLEIISNMAIRVSDAENDGVSRAETKE